MAPVLDRRILLFFGVLLCEFFCVFLYVFQRRNLAEKLDYNRLIARRN